jgi:dynein heavy chain
MVFVAGMMPRNPPSIRLLRHFFVLFIEPYDFDSLLHIFNSIIVEHFKKNNFTTEVLDAQSNLVQSTINLYNEIKLTPELLPSPKKAHYIINLRDIARVCQGLQ